MSIMNLKKCKRFAASSKKVIGGLVTLCLLVPVPVFAITFSGVNWTTTQSSGNALFDSVTPADFTDHTVLTFSVIAGTSVFGTAKVEGTGLANIGASDTLHGSWQGLTNLNIVQPGGGGSSVTISITIDTPANNMFLPTTYSSAPLADPTIMPSGTGLTSTSKITILFDYTKGSGVTIGTFGSLSATTFTLTFTDH
jgi:hypothetical protein